MKGTIVTRASVVGVVVCLSLASLAWAAPNDWPQWKCDAGRNGLSDGKMSGELKLAWTRQLPKPRQAWPKPQWKLHFDKSYEPIVAGKMLYVGSMVNDSLTAYDTTTGKEVWRFFTEGPVRFAPVAYDGRVYCPSDDGFLYCLDGKTGKLVWKFHAAPDNRRVLGNGRLCSLWPVRGAPVLHNDTLYFAAGLWPFMGTFFYALDPKTHTLRWTNSGTGAMWNQQPHGGAIAFAGIAPQGYFAAHDKFLIVPNSRNVPAIFDIKTGRLRHLSQYYKWRGGYAVNAAWGGYYNFGKRYNVATGGQSSGTPGYLATDDVIFQIHDNGATLKGLKHRWVKGVDKNGKPTTAGKFDTVWTGSLSPKMGDIRIKVGDHLYGLGEGNTVVGTALLDGGKVKVDFVGKYEGKFWRMLAGDGKLFVVTEEGRVFCYGPGGGAVVDHKLKTAALPVRGDAAWVDRAKALLKACGTTEGYAVSLGIGSGRLIEEILNRSKLYVIVIDPDAKKVDAFRRRMQAAGLYGERTCALVGNGFDYDLPAYIASLIFSEDIQAAGFDASKTKVQRLIAPLRPYGGTACLPAGSVGGQALAKWAQTGPMDGAKVEKTPDGIRIRRPGALPNAAGWTHQYADPANSVVGAEKRVKLPLGMLWFGGNTHLDILPRHGHGPTPQVAGGRLVIEGINMISARDVYTGRVLWKRNIKGFTNFNMYWDRSFKDNIYDKSYNQVHIPGANLYGANYVTTEDSVYLANGPDLLVLDAATGKTTQTFRLPKRGDVQPNWGVVLNVGDLLIAGGEPMGIRIGIKKGQKPAPLAKTFEPGKVPGVTLNKPFAPRSRRLVVLNRRTGKVLWSRAAKVAFRHNAIVATDDPSTGSGQGRVFVIDGLSGQQTHALTMKGQPVPARTLLALDLKTGKEVWKTDQDVFGTWLGYKKTHDVLVQCGSASRDRSGDETRKGMVAYQGKTGKVLWKDLQRNHAGPVMLVGDTMFTNGGEGGTAYELLTGKPRAARHPLTGKPLQRKWHRHYGCNTAIASESLMTFRSGAAGYYDLTNPGGTGNFGGFKSGCTSSLVPADGVLNAPDYTRTCICSYPLQSSLALVHMPDVEVWTYDKQLPPPGTEPITRLGLNIGAPGDRLHEGTLWLDVPSAGSPSPAVDATLLPFKMVQLTVGRREHRNTVTVPQFTGVVYRYHSLTITNGPLRWVAASGADNCAGLTVTLRPGGTASKPYTVRLVFAEPFAAVKPGQRVFDVVVQGKTVRAGFDIVQAAGGANRSTVLEFKNIPVKDKVIVELKAKKGSTLLCGAQFIAE